MLCLGRFVANTTSCSACLLEVGLMLVSLGARCWCIPKSKRFLLLPPQSLAALLTESSQILKNQLYSQKGFKKLSL